MYSRLQRLEYGPGAINAAFPSSEAFGLGRVIFKLSGFHCSSFLALHGLFNGCVLGYLV